MSQVKIEGDTPGQWIERQCEALGTSIAEVARESGVSRQTICRWRKGDRPYWDTFERVRITIESRWEREKKVGGF